MKAPFPLRAAKSFVTQDRLSDMIVKKLMRRRITNDIWEQVKTAFASGIGLREIARNMNLSENTVLSRAQREGWTQEIQNAKALAKREDAPVISPVDAAAMSLHQRGERHVERMAGVSEKVVSHVESLNRA